MLSSMGEGKKNKCLELGGSILKEKNEWVVNNSSSSSSSVSMGDSDSSSSLSSSSFETTDDASSSSSSSSSLAQDSSSMNGSLYDLSDLMTQLPIKIGLSKYYKGKSESFTCLARVTSVEDLVKKEIPYNKRRRILKGCKSYGGGLDNYKSYTQPKPIISKKSFKAGNSFSSSFPSRNVGSFTRPPLIPSQKD